MEPAFELLGLGANLAALLLGGGTDSYGFFLGLQESLLRGALRLGDPPPGLHFRLVEVQALVSAEVDLGEDVDAHTHKDRGAHHQEQNDWCRHWLVHLLLILL